MDIAAFTNLLSRYYIYGFAAPIFGWLAVLDLSLTKDFKPYFFADFGFKQFAALAVASILLTILVVPWRHELFALFSGRLSRSKPWLPYGRAIASWRNEIERTWKGEMMGELWPLVRSLTSDREQAYLDEGETNATSLVLTAYLALLTIPILAFDFYSHRKPTWSAWIGVLVAILAVFVILYWQATKAARRNGTQVKASVTLHYAEVVETRAQAENRKQP